MTNPADIDSPAVLIIMDGFGIADAGPGNAISAAATPTLDAIGATHPSTLLQAGGLAVGLPEGQMGNSEVGHLNIGAGRVVDQELTRIDRACDDGSIRDNAVLRQAMEAVNDAGSVLHLMGLLSDGGVHSSERHLVALMDMAASLGVKRVFIHCFGDGRDVPPSSMATYLQRLRDTIDRIEAQADTTFTIAGLYGRYYAMDRDRRWDRVQLAYDALVHAQPHSTSTPEEYLRESYAADVTDEFLVPASFVDRPLSADDSLVFFNFRPDRAREITRALTDRVFDGFERGDAVFPRFVCLTEYDPDIDAPIAFPKSFPDHVLADVLAEHGIAQYHIAETEKYAHVTFFLNGGREEAKPGEERELIASPKVATYDLQPQMSEPEVASTLARAIRDGAADVFIVNFANCDMVGHTGIIDATVRAVESVDAGVAEVLDAVRDRHGFALVTADHGNADRMLGEDGVPYTAHSTAPVPFVLVDATGKGRALRPGTGALCDIAPTFLDVMGLDRPAEMTGSSLLAK